jgi:hypothetical protein
MSEELERLSSEELEAEAGAALPDKEVMSVPLLDLNVDVDLALDLAAPVDLAAAANANVALPVDAAVAANVLSAGSTAAAQASQGVMIDQLISGEAIAEGNQDSSIEQGEDGGAEGDTGLPAVPPTGGTDLPDVPTDLDSVLGAGLLNVDANVALDGDVTAPVAGAVAANANVAAPIDAAVAANVGSIDSDAVAVADQTAIISQELDDVTAEATVDQDSEIEQ